MQPDRSAMGVEPAGQTQSDDEVEPGAVRKSVVQESHREVPTALAYVPLAHSVQAAALVAAGVALALPASHSWQSSALAEPSTALYDPAAQSTHSVAPTAALA